MVPPQPLAGIRVVDVTTMIAGPTLGRLFAELGADVVHVEPPQGDDGRNTTTRYLGREGIFYSTANRSKRGIVADLRTERGREVIQRLATTADLFVENASPGTMAGHGLGYSTLSELNPELVYVSISAWGASGPLADQPGYDVLIQAYTGMMAWPPTGGAPLFNGTLIADATTPILGAFAAMVALRERERTGHGSHVTTSLLQGALHVLGAAQLIAEEDRTPPGPRRSLPGGSGIFETADAQHVVIGAWTDAQFATLSRLAEFSHLPEDPAYATRLNRQDAAGELNELFQVWTSGYSLESIVELLRENGIPCSPVTRGMGTLKDDQQIQANQFVVGVTHPALGILWQSSPAFEIDGRRGELRAAPTFGQHTVEVLTELGYSEQEIHSMREAGCVL